MPWEFLMGLKLREENHKKTDGYLVVEPIFKSGIPFFLSFPFKFLKEV